MLRIEHVTIQYRSKKGVVPVIQDLSLEIREGEALVILGASGCGKSTLINALAGTLAVENGSINFIQGQQKQPLNPRLHKIGLIPQNCGLLPWKTVRENCSLPLKIRNIPVDSAYREEINRIYEALDIVALLDEYPNRLSGGQLQRAAIARALILKPDLLLMDEPFSALDALTREEARELFLGVWKQIRPTTVLVTHSIEEALYLGSSICVMEEQKGRIGCHIDNPYFGKPYPEDMDYLQLRKQLRERLRTKRERGKADGRHTETN